MQGVPFFWIHSPVSHSTSRSSGHSYGPPEQLDEITYNDLMKLIIAIIQPHHLESVKTSLSQVEVFRLTIMDCQGFGQQGGTSSYGSDEMSGNLRRKIQLQIAVNEQFVEPTIQAIIEGGRSGESGTVGDGKIFVLPLEDCIRIRTGERGSDAI